MAVIPNQQTPNPYYVKPFNPNSSTATPSPTTPNPVGGQRVGNLYDAVNADGSPYQWSGGATPQPGQYSSPSMPNTPYSRQTPQMSTQSNSIAVPNMDPGFSMKSNFIGDPGFGMKSNFIGDPGFNINQNRPKMSTNYPNTTGPAVPTNYPNTTGSAVSTNYGLPLTPQVANPSNSVAVPNTPRWNVDAPAAERIAHMKDPNNIADARNELLASKSIYGQKSGAGDLSGAWGAHTWADEVRAAAGISNDDPLYGNAATPIITGDVTKPATPAAGNGFTPPFKSPWTIDPAQAAQAAREQTAAKFRQMLDAGKNAWQTGIVGAKNAFDYTNKVNADNRVLRNEQFKENNNPFGGQFVYDKTNMLRNDNLQDTTLDADYQNKVNSLNQTWADLQSAAPGQEQALYDQLYQQAAALGIQADQLNLQGNQQAFNQFDANRKFDYGVSQDTVKNGQWDKTFNHNAAQDALKNSAAYTGYIPDGKGGMMATTAEQERQLGNLWKAADQSGTIPNELADMYGIPRGTQTQAAKQFAQSLSVQQQNANTSSANSTTSANAQKINQLMDVWKNTGKAPTGLESLGVQPGESFNTELKDTEISDLINQSPLVKKQYDDNGKLIGTTVDEASKNGLMLYIKSLPGMTADKAKPWFIKYGLYSGN